VDTPPCGALSHRHGQPAVLPGDGHPSHRAWEHRIRSNDERTPDAGSDADTAHAYLFAERLNPLFETGATPTGAPSTSKDVSAATRITRQYLSLARRGLFKKPSAWYVHKIAEFVVVDDSFFTREALGPGGENRLDDRLLRALANPLIRHIARRASALSKPPQAVVFRMVEDVYALTAHYSSGTAATDNQNLVEIDSDVEGQVARGARRDRMRVPG